MLFLDVIVVLLVLFLDRMDLFLRLSEKLHRAHRGTSRRGEETWSRCAVFAQPRPSSLIPDSDEGQHIDFKRYHYSYRSVRSPLCPTPDPPGSPSTFLTLQLRDVRDEQHKLRRARLPTRHLERDNHGAEKYDGRRAKEKRVKEVNERGTS
jgi:hypothetical protein